MPDIRKTLGWSAAILLALCTPILAQDSPFARGWTLDAGASNIRFQSIKNSTKVESSSFATFTGQIAPDGTATLEILLDSVDTAVDLRNVRMRFLFFETFNFPQATISTRIDPATIADLGQSRRKVLTLPFTLNLHGVTKTLFADVVATLLTDDIVSVASSAPITLPVADFNLSDNLVKLEEAANVVIVPSTSVTFDFLFNRNGDGAVPMTAKAETPAKPAKVALEAEGDFSLEACIGRFEILSRTGNIEFRSGSARLDNSSDALLENVTDIVTRCPDLRLELAGHTDSDGSDAANLKLSQSRAASVKAYLTAKGIAAARLETTGYGEAQPLVPNDSATNKRRNRRIEFVVLQ